MRPFMHHTAVAGLFLAALIHAVPMNAQVDRSKPPRPAPPPTVNVGQHTTFLLANGMRVILVEDHRQPMVNMQVRFDIEPVMQGDKAGYLDLLGEMLAAGTASLDKEALDRRVDQLGGSLSTTSDGVYASCLKKNHDALLELVQAVVTTPTFPDAEFEKARKRMLSGLQSRKDDPDAIADVVGRALTFSKGYPYGEVPTEKSVAKVERKHLEAYYKRFFRPEKGFLVLVGDLTEQEARAAAEKRFASWRPAPVAGTLDADGREMVDGLGPVIRPTKTPRPHKVRRVAVVDRPGAPQSVLRVVYPVELRPNDPMAQAGQVMNTILGGGVFNARLMQNLREDKGYTYGAYSSLDPDKYCGHFSAGASVRTEVTDSAAGEMIFELEHMRLNGVSPDELALAKSYMAGSFARSLEDPRTVARFALNTYLYDLPKDHYTNYLKRLDTVSAASVKAAAERFLHPDNATILVVGDMERVGNKLVPLSFERGVTQLDENGDPFREELGPVPAGVTPQTVLEAYFKAIGGRTAVEAVRSLKRSMSTTAMGMPVTITEWNAEPDRYAMEMRSGTMLLQQVRCDGTRARRNGPGGSEEIIEMELEEMEMNAPPFPELHYPKIGRMVLPGTVQVDGEQAYKITVLTDMGSTFSEYYSVASGLKLRREEMKATPDGNMKVITDLKDYREVKGVLFPHLILQKGPMDMTLTVTEVLVNGAADAKHYSLD
ncbi:MAG: hypothetical protein GFGODING_01496 [Flavobacteriales bacterium]|nr:hypothetical protein [Flavobacteriales bacterium]